jgi:hypothetical protein
MIINMKKKLAAVFVILFAGVPAMLMGQSIGFTGVGRALVTNNVERDSTRALGKQKATDGYTLFDLGVNAETEVIRVGAILRIRNELGGFFSDGSSIGFRQVQMEGTIGKKIKYELGDIYMSHTPYTINNFEEMYNEYEAEIFRMRRNVVYYENFFIDNKWRLQGLNMYTKINYGKYIQSIGVRTYGGRLGVTNYTAAPDRLFYGGRLEIVQSDMLKIGGNVTGITDLSRTATNAQNVFDNYVSTSDLKFTYNKLEKITFGLMGEFGFSRYNLKINETDSTYTEDKRKDFFYDAGLFTEVKPLNLKVTAAYRNVGPSFISPMAQSRRIWDVGSVAEVFPTYANGKFNREITLMDRYSQETGLYNNTVSIKFMQFNPVLNNITPYGQATPNRTGISAGLAYEKEEGLVSVKFGTDLLQEIHTEDSASAQLRKFTGFKGGLIFNIHRLIKIDREIILQAGGRSEQTTRGGLNSVKLNSTLIDGGLQAELIKDLSLLLGIKYLKGTGNEYINIRNDFNNIVSIYNQRFKVAQQVFAFGMKYKFGKAGSFTAQYHISNYNNKVAADPDIRMKYLFLMYSLQF